MGFIAIVLAVLLVGAVIVYDAFAWGLVVQKFWGWFLMPLLAEQGVMIDPISFKIAIGAAFFIGLFHAKIFTSIKKEYKDGTTEAIGALIAPWITLLIGAIVYHWIIL